MDNRLLLTLQERRDQHYALADEAYDCGDMNVYTAEYNIAHGISEAISLYIQGVYR